MTLTEEVQRIKESLCRDCAIIFSKSNGEEFQKHLGHNLVEITVVKTGEHALFDVKCNTCNKLVSGYSLEDHKGHDMADNYRTKEDVQKSIKELGEKQDKKSDIYYTVSGGKKIYKILDHPIKELSPQALIDNIAFVAAYFPTEVEITKKNGPVTEKTTDWVNQGFFVTNDYNKQYPYSKKKIPVDDDGIKSLYKINVMNVGNQRWRHEDMLSWQKSDAKINPVELLTKMHDVFPKYLELEDETTYFVLYLWIIGTYFYRLFSAYPYLDFTGTKRAGKTKALELINLIAFNGIMSPDLTGSVMFRVIEQTGATICIDEAEQMKNQKSEQAQQVRTLLNQGFKKNMYAYRSDTKEKGFNPVPFNLYSPKAFGHINAFDDVLEDRCIQILMKRSTKKTIQNTHPSEYDKVWWDIRDMCYRLFLDYTDIIETLKQKAEETMPVSGRERELWHPILTLANLFESFGLQGIIEKVRKFALESSDTRQSTDEEENPDYKIVSYLADLVAQNDTIQTSPSELWADFDKKMDQFGFDKKYYGERRFSNTLHRLGLVAKRTNKKRYYTITEAAVTLMKQRLGMIPVSEENSVISVTASPLGTKIDEFTESDTINVVTTSVTVTNPENRHESDAVTQVTQKNDIDVTGDNSGNDTSRHTASLDYPKLASFNINSSFLQDSREIKPEELYICTTCDNAGPFKGSEESKSSGNIVNYHFKLGHKVMRV